VSEAVEIRAPQQTDGTRAQILRWLKSVGDSVEQDEPLIELETDKVTVEVPAPHSGVLREIVKREQEEVAPGELLGRIEATAAPASSGRPALNQGGDSASTEPPRQGAARQRVRTDEADALSPAVRRLLAEKGLDPLALKGTGGGGRITVQDVLRAAAATSTVPATDSAPATGTPSVTSAPPSATAGPPRLIPHSPVRKRIAEHMVRSLQTAPHVTTVFEADLSAVLADRARQREAFAERGVPLTLTAYFLQAAVSAIRAVPEANSRWSDSALEVFDYIHVGVATAIEDGLIVPVLRDLQSRDLWQTASGLHELVSRARAHRLSPADVRDGTFTISNHGVSGSLLAAPIVINQPQSAILGIGKVERRVVAVDDGAGGDRLIVRPRCYVTLTIDHRVMDGERANRFLQTFVERLNQWNA
jgi:2-oxoglutarate dehydrogenase E2 component (dihydrolipoamide succinyltransferase)